MSALAKLIAVGVIVFALAFGIGIGVLCAAAGMVHGAHPHRPQTSVPPVIHHHYYDNRTIVIQSPPDSIGRQHARAMLNQPNDAD